MANFFDQFDGASETPQGGPDYSRAISSIESGGNYKAIGPATKTGDRALGKYQVMSANVGPWSREVLGREVSPQEFIASPEIQDAIFKGKFGQYAEKYGPEGAAKAWFAGEKGMNNQNSKDVLGTTVASYGAKFNKALGYAPEDKRQTDVGAQSNPKVNFFDQFDSAPPEAAQPEQSIDPIVASREELARGLKAGKRGDLDTYRAAAFRTNQGVPAAGATEAAISGATGGFADEASAASRAPIDMLIRGEGFDEAYQHNLAAERDRLAQYQKASPIASTAAEVAGSLAMPLGKAGAIKTGLAQGALYGAGNSEGDVAQRAADAAVGGVASGALGGVVSGIGRVVGGKAPSATPSIQELKDAATKGYQSEAVKGLEINPKAAADIATSIRVKLDDQGFDDVVSTKAHAILKKLETVPDGGTVTGQNLHSFQKTLGKAAGSIDPQEKAAASIALSEFNKRLEAIDPSHVIRGSADDFSRTMKEANANYNAASQSGKIDKKTVDATIRAGAANSGMNAGNTIRQRMADVAIRPAERRGLLPEEVATAERIAMGSRTENALRKGGNALGGGGGIGTLAAAAAGMGAAGAYTQDPGSAFAGLALPALGLAMRGMGNRMTMKQAEKLSEAIRKRAPLSSATTKFEEKVAQFQQQRNAKNGVAAALAARNLATNLRGSGFNVSVSDLMRSLEGPAATRAEDQPQVSGPPSQ
jgi:hypothetical protein